MVLLISAKYLRARRGDSGLQDELVGTRVVWDPVLGYLTPHLPRSGSPTRRCLPIDLPLSELR